MRSVTSDLLKCRLRTVLRLCGPLAKVGADRHALWCATNRQDMKELKLRPSTDVHDYQVRLRAAQKFLAKVRILRLLIASTAQARRFLGV